MRRGTRRWRWIPLALLVLPIALFLLSNLALTSRWGCRWIAGKITQRTGLDARVGGATWSPWRGATLRSIELLQPASLRTVVPEALLKVAEIQITPVWRAWLRGKPEVRSITLHEPRICLPLELIAHFAIPPLAAAHASSVPNAAPASPPTARPPVIPPAPITPPGVVTETSPPHFPAQPTGWIHLHDASFTLIHTESQHHLLDLTAISGSIPTAGDSAQATLNFGKISVAGVEITPRLTASLDWTPPRLTLKPLDLTILGYECKISGQLGMFHKLPIAFEAQLPRQALGPIHLPFDAQFAAGGFAANARFGGLLLAPITWQADLVTEATSPVIHIASQEAKFERGSSITVLRGGALSCVDIRLIGDELSLLGNATLLADGRLAAAARLVAHPATASALAGGVFPNISGARPFTALATPQRVAFDLHALGNISQVDLQLGNQGPIVHLKR